MTLYTGRFAPSPTGPLHMGSLIAALASYLEARAAGGRWLLRMEDIDPPREVAGAAEAIIKSLLAHGLQWDGEILWQSQQASHYAAAIQQLLDNGDAFYCVCSRRDLEGTGGVYPGTCRGRHETPGEPYAIRLRVPDRSIMIDDALQGRFGQNLEHEVGDVVLQRKDGLYAYQLAVVVDDALQGVTHVLRGSDLLDSAPRQRYLQQRLGLPAVEYAHIPVLMNAQGQKLSKQNLAPEISSRQAAANLREALSYLQQPLPAEHWSVPEILAEAQSCWRLRNLPRQMSISQS